MSETTASYDALAVGARVRERTMRADRPPREGIVVEDRDEPSPLPSHCVFVRWDGDPYGCKRWTERRERLEVIDAPPARAPERELCPGIVQSDDTCDGMPRIVGTRLRTDALDSYWRREVAEGHGPGTAARHVASDYHTTAESVLIAVTFEAGRHFERERRAARKERRRARRWEASKAASEGVER